MDVLSEFQFLDLLPLSGSVLPYYVCFLCLSTKKDNHRINLQLKNFDNLSIDSRIQLDCCQITAYNLCQTKKFHSKFDYFHDPTILIFADRPLDKEAY